MLKTPVPDPASSAIACERGHDALTPEFRAEMRVLADNPAEPNAFVEDWFLIPALRHFGAGVKLIEVRSLDGQLAGLIPLHIHGNYGRMPVRHVRNWVHYQSFMGTPLIRQGCESLFWSALIGWLDDIGWAKGFLTIAEIERDGHVHRGLVAACSTLARPCALVHGYERALLASTLDAEAYLEKALRGKKRKELRRLENRLRETGDLQFEVLDNKNELTGWCDTFLALEAAGWKGERGAALANAAATRAFFVEVVEGANAAGKLDFQRLTLDGRAIAMLVNFRTPPGSWSFKIAYDEALARYSPGVMIELENLARVLGDPEIGWMDSCAVEGHPMIDRLWTERRKLVQVTVPLSGLGRRAIHGLCRAAETASSVIRRYAA